MTKARAEAGLVLSLTIALAIGVFLIFSEPQKITCKPCIFADEENVKQVFWDENDPELAEYPVDEDPGIHTDIMDSDGHVTKALPAGYPGIKSMHMPLIRGFITPSSDQHGHPTYCRPCREAKTEEDEEGEDDDCEDDDASSCEEHRRDRRAHV